MSFRLNLVLVSLILTPLAAQPTSAGDPQTASISKPALNWHTRYQTAWDIAEREQKMLLILFDSPTQTDEVRLAEETIRSHSQIADHLHEYVLVKLPMDTKISVQGKPVELLKHDSFSEMHARAGLAIIDLVSKDKDYYGHVVSAFPFMQGKYYRFQRRFLPAIFGLPRGTITQRTMVWAVRVHPEHPRSTHGKPSNTLANAAKSHSNHQASIGSQGHHNWESRFHQIAGSLKGGLTPTEVVAESWPNQTMIDSCIDCVDSWRQSSGHWNAVNSHQTVYGYDIKRGSNGIWYGTGLFAR